MYSKKINQLATNLNPQSTDLIAIGDAETGQLKTTTYNLLSGVSSDGVISGGIVTWTGTGLVFNISACVYYLNGVRYSSPFSTKTLAAADPTNPRIDVFAVNTSGQVEVIQGTPAANPVEPEGDTATTLGLTNVTINAGATTPTNVSRDLIYDENVESWTKTFTQSASSVNYADTAFPYTGTKSILVTMGFGYVFLSFSKAVALDISNYKSLSFAIRLNAAWTSNQILSVQFYNGTTLITNTYTINSANTVGFNRNLAGTYQLITIPLNGILLKFKSNAFTEVRIRTQNAAATYRLDTIQLNGGISNPTGGGTSANSFGFVNGSTGSAASTQATDTLNVVGTGLATTSASGKTLTIAVPSPIPSQTGNNGKYLTTDGSVLSWATVSGGTDFYTTNGTLTSDRTITSNGFILNITGGKKEPNGQIALRLSGSATTEDIYLNLKNTNASGREYAFRSLTNGRFELIDYTTSVGVSMMLSNTTFTQITANSVPFLFGRETNLISGLWINVAAGSQTLANSTILKNGTETILSSASIIRFYNGSIDVGRVITTTGNWILQNGGTFTDAGFRLDVNGTARVTGNLTTNTTAGSVLFAGVGGILQQDNANFFWDDTNNRLGIGTNTPTNAVHIAANINSGFSGLNISNSNTGNAAISTILVSNDTGAFTIQAVGSGFTPSGMLQPNSARFRASAALVNGFYFGTGQAATPGPIVLFTNDIERARITGAGRLLLGTTTESTFLLDVNGTGRFSGALTVTGSTTAASAIARGALVSSTLVAAANNDVLVGLDINPTFTNGAFTGVSNYALRLNTTLATGAWNIYASGTANNYLNGRLFVGSTTPVSTERFGIYNTNAGSSVFMRIQNLGTTTNTASAIILSTQTAVGGLGAVSSTITSLATDAIGNTALTFLTSTAEVGSEKMRLTAEGRLLVGATTPVGLERFGVYATNGGGAVQMRIQNLGQSANTSSVLIFTTNTSSTQGPVGCSITSLANDTSGNASLLFATSTADFGSEKMRLTAAGRLLLGTTTESTFLLDVNGQTRSTQYNLSALNTAPATATSTGTLGEIRIDANHIYICTATNTWKRVAIATF